MGVQLNIKDPETVRLARELAGQTRRSVTETVRVALEKTAEERGEAVAAGLEARLAAVTRRLADTTCPRTVLVTGRLGNGLLLIARQDTYTGDALVRGGACPALANRGLAQVSPEAVLAADPDAREKEIEAAEQFAVQAPTLIVVFSSPKLTAKIPQWEQELSVGASCMALLAATHAEGYVGGWLTGWPSYSPQVAEALGAHPHERIAGFIFIGTAGRELEERPRPALEEVVSVWQPS